jgi:hypothetical protein
MQGTLAVEYLSGKVTPSAPSAYAKCFDPQERPAGKGVALGVRVGAPPRPDRMIGPSLWSARINTRFSLRPVPQGRELENWIEEHAPLDRAAGREPAR